MRQQRSWAVVFLAVALAACTSGGTGNWAGSVTDSAGVRIVSNPAEGIWTPADRWTVEEDLRIGALEGKPDYQFGQVAGIAVDSKGSIYALDMQAQHIQVYSKDGEYVRTIGGKGGGPGELGGATFVVMGPGDTLLVPDIANRRVNLFGPDGVSLGSYPLALEQGMPMNFRSTASGLIAEQIRPLDLPNMPAHDSMDAILVITAAGTVQDTLKRFPSGKTISFSSGVPEFNFYSPEAAWDIGDDGTLVFGINNDYRIDFYSGGQIERIVEKAFEPKAVTEADRQAVMDYLEKTWTDAGVPPQFLDRLKSGVHFGESLPAFAALVAGPDGTLWVQHIQAVSDLSEKEAESFDLLQDSGAPDWDIFDSEGKFLGTVTMPRRFAPRLIRDGYVYGVWRDELDVQYVLRMRIVGATT